jgi:hypothetical protein
MSSGRQLLSIVGQAVGSAFGPIGAAVGGIIGGEIGGVIDGPPEGPRLDDLSAPQIQFGGKIGRLYGGPKWFEVGPLYASEKRESSEVVGGKGGDSGVEQFSYRCDFLFRVCESREGTPCEVIAVTGVEIDGQLVWTALADATPESLQASADQEDWAEMTVQLGHEDQAPWSVYEAAVGATNANAYRGYLTVGFTDFLLGQGGAPRRVRIQCITAGTMDPLVVEEMDPLVERINWTDGLTVVFPATSLDTKVEFNGPEVEHITGDPWRLSFDLYVPNNPNDNVIGPSVITYGYGPLEYIEVVLYGTAAQLTINTVAFGYPEYFIGPNMAGTTRRVVLEMASGSPSATFTVKVDNVLYLSTSMPNNNLVNSGLLTIGLRGATTISGTHGYTIDNVVFEAPLRTITTYDRWAPQPVQLRDILEYEAERCAPLAAANIDFSAAASLEVDCHVAVGSAAEAMQPLLTRFWFDLYSADKLVLVRRGGAVEQTIPFRWTGAGAGERSEPFAGLVRGNDVEVPKKKAVTYSDLLKDGETDTRTGDRESVGSDVETMQLNLHMRPSQAQGLADTATWDARIAGHTATIRVGARHGLKMQPGSVVNLVDHKGNTYRVLVRRIVWTGWVWECEVRLDDPNVLTAAGIAVDVDQRALTVAEPPEATLYMLDIPLLRVQDDGPGEYAAITQTGRFRGVDILKSTDGVTYSKVAEIATRGTAGVCDSALPAYAGWGWDNGCILTVTLDDGSGGTLSSATKAAVEANRFLNLAAVGAHGRWELVQFATATLTVGSTYQLTGILRNRFGTEWANADHEVGDAFVLLQASGMARVPGAVADLGQTRHYKAVPRGRASTNVTAESIVCEQQALLPYAPVDVRNDAGTVRWNRRSRMEGVIGADPPLGQVNERYDAELYDGVTLEDSDTGLVSPEWTPTDPAGLTVRVYQLSDLIGRGHVAEKAIP